jgi:hypothetical protein
MRSCVKPAFGDVSGEQFFRIVTPSVTPGNSVHSTATFDFSSPVNAFGLSLTGLGTDDGSSVTLQFLDGSTQTLPIAGGTLAQIEAEFARHRPARPAPSTAPISTRESVIRFRAT